MPGCADNACARGGSGRASHRTSSHHVLFAPVPAATPVATPEDAAPADAMSAREPPPAPEAASAAAPNAAVPVAADAPAPAAVTGTAPLMQLAQLAQQQQQQQQQQENGQQHDEADVADSAATTASANTASCNAPPTLTPTPANVAATTDTLATVAVTGAKVDAVGASLLPASNSTISFLRMQRDHPIFTSSAAAAHECHLRKVKTAHAMVNNCLMFSYLVASGKMPSSFAEQSKPCAALPDNIAPHNHPIVLA